ncbi:MAG: tetratricopeptide repeat protein [Pirellulaceae bacterium]|nr:tetratricopeptide repeat protein [Pirellulaceae bacterium]
MRIQPAQFVSATLILALAVSASPTVGGEAEDQYAVSAGLYARQQWGLAAEAFGEFVERFPNHAKADQAVFFLAESLLQQDELDKASARFAEYLRRSPDGPQARSARFRLAEAAYLTGRLDEAGRDLSAFHRDHPDDPRTGYVLAYLGEIALAQGDCRVAVDYFRRAMTHAPARPLENNIRLGLARALQQLGELDEASGLYRSLIGEKLGVMSDEARFRLGVLQYARGDHAEAVATLLPLEENPANDDWRLPGRLMRGLSLRNLGQLDQAAVLLGSVTADPRLGAEAQYWLAAVYKDRQQWDDAAAVLLAAAGQFPDHRLNAAMRFHAGHAMLLAGRSDEANEQFDRILEDKRAESEWFDDAAMGKLQLAQLAKNHADIDRQAERFLSRFPDSSLADDARHAWARSLVARREQGRAVELLAKLLAAKPDDDRAAWARANLAVGLAKLGRWEEADATLADFLDRHPKHDAAASALEAFAETAYEAREWARAERIFQMLVDRGDDKQAVDRAMSGLAWTRLDGGQFAEAAELFQKLLERKPEKSLAADTAWAGAHALEKLGRDADAADLYDEAVKQNPDGPRVAKILLSAARLHARLGRNGRAATIYQRLVADHPDDKQLDAVLYEWSWTLSDQGRDDEAAACLERLHREFAESRYWDDATYRLAERAFEAADHDAAERLIDGVLATGESREIAPYALALKWRVAAARQQWDTVGETAQRLLDRHSAGSFRAAARFWLAESLYRRGDYDRAAEVFQSLAEETDENESWRAMVPLRRAQIAASRKEWLDAHELASSIERDYPDFVCQHEADYVVGRALAARAEFDAARDAYQRVIRSPRGAKTETAAMAQWMIGETYFHQKNFEAALREYLRVEILYDYPRWQAAALLQAGKCCKRLGRVADAEKLYERLVQNFPDTQFADEARRGIGD